jgi:hypothetical protein
MKIFIILLSILVGVPLLVIGHIWYDSYQIWQECEIERQADPNRVEVAPYNENSKYTEKQQDAMWTSFWLMMIFFFCCSSRTPWGIIIGFILCFIACMNLLISGVLW